MPQASILYSLPDFDIATRIGSGWIASTIKTAEHYKFNIIKLIGENANPDNWHKETINAQFITGVGHGDFCCFTGQHRRILWACYNLNPKEVEGKAVFLVSCETGKKLGPTIIEKGGLWFIGWDSLFVFYTQTPYYDPGDRYQRSFFSPIQALYNNLYSGGTAFDAYTVYAKHMQEEIEKYESDRPHIADALRHDLKHCVTLGDVDKPIPKPTPPAPPTVKKIYVCPCCDYESESKEDVINHIFNNHIKTKTITYEVFTCT